MRWSGSVLRPARRSDQASSLDRLGRGARGSAEDRKADVSLQSVWPWFVYSPAAATAPSIPAITTDPARREAAHNAGRGAAYTRSRRPVRLVHLEPAADRGRGAPAGAGDQATDPGGRRKRW